MNETELLDSLHDAQILAIKQDGRRVIIEINYVAEWEPQEEKGHYRLVYVPAGLIFKEAEVVTRTGDYARLGELPAGHAARTILWVDAVDDASADSGHHIYHFITPGDGSLAIRAESVRLERWTSPSSTPTPGRGSWLGDERRRKGRKGKRHEET